MGKEVGEQSDRDSLESRPGVLVVGPSNVGKRSLLSRLLTVDLSDASDLSSEILCYGWTIDTKYYTADLSIWVAHLGEEFPVGSIPVLKQIDALVMVFDLSDLASFTILQEWVSSIDIKTFEILLCIGNKADLLPGHFAHAEYRRYLQKHGESSTDPHPEYLDYGILETEGSSLLGDEEPSWEIRRSCLEWCSQYNIEYIEACASNMDFDKCLSVNGDSQGVERLYGALSAHMWPGMILKSGNRIPELSLAEKEDFSDESDYEIEYEILSRGSDEPWDGMDGSWVALNDIPTATDEGEASVRRNNVPVPDKVEKNEAGNAAKIQESSISEVTVQEEAESKTDGVPVPEVSEASASKIPVLEVSESKVAEVQVEEVTETKEAKFPVQEESEAKMVEVSETDEDMRYGFEDIEKLMCEISHMRDSLRLLPDFQRREMAGKLAMKMATMFADSSDEEGSDQ